MNPLNMPKRRTALKVKTPHPPAWRKTVRVPGTKRVKVLL